MAREIESAGQVSHIEGAGRDANKTQNHAKDVAIDVVWLNSMISRMRTRPELRHDDSTHGNSASFVCICRVPAHIRKHDHSAYNPKIISIGPFHHGKRNLRAMEVNKWRYLRKVVPEPEKNLEKFLKKMKEIETPARESYSGNIDMRSKEFVEMMLLDGCFIIYFILMQTQPKDAEPDMLIYNNIWMSTLIHHDMLLLENQLPFIVLERLWELIGRTSAELKKAALVPFSTTFDGYTIDEPNIERAGVFHLLDLIHSSFKPASHTQRSPTQKSPCRSVIAKLFPLQFLTFLRPERLVETHDGHPTPGQQSLPESKDKAPPPSMKIPSVTELQEAGAVDTHDRHPTPGQQSLPESKDKAPPPRTKNNSATEPQEAGVVDTHERHPTPGQQSLPESKDKAPPPWKKIPSATELQEAGVEFKRKKSASSFFDVTFGHGLMEMPRLWVSGYTNTRFRNFIAFEQCFPAFGNHFTTYCIFIDFLVNTSRDVSILSESGIVKHGLGSDEDVALLFNKLCKEIVWAPKDTYLADVFKKATQYTKKRCHKWRAKLCHDYFSNPWSIISLIAAIIVISVAFVQTFFTVFPYYRPSKP